MLDVVIAFDTPSDRRRRKFTALLNRSGRRVQKSVFRLQGTPRQLALLWEGLQRICLPEEDAVFMCQVRTGSWQQFGEPAVSEPDTTCVL